ncbi:MAG: ABC transporter permease [Phycisphaerales bacterium]|nr:ABC transporter permease [Phycisphaerales bacterium]
MSAIQPRRFAARILSPTLLGGVVLGAMLLCCVGSLPWTMARVERVGSAPTRRYEAGNLELSLLAPSWWEDSQQLSAKVEQQRAAGGYVPTRILGTDRLGRDVLARCLMGGAVSLLIGLIAAAVAVGFGTLFGTTSAACGGRIDNAMMRSVDVMYGLPSMLLVVMLAVAAEGILRRLGVDRVGGGHQVFDVAILVLAIGATSWLTVARVIRGQVLSLRGQLFMESCRAVGVGPWRQFWLHYLPNVIAVIAVYAALAVPAAILSESFLSFLGIGVRDPLPSWGNLAAEGLSEVNTIRSRWWLLSWPCLAIAITLLALNFVGDALRASVDPTSRRRPIAA